MAAKPATDVAKLRDVIVALQSDKRALLEERVVLERRAGESAARAQALAQALEAGKATAARAAAAAASLQSQVDQLQAQRGALAAVVQVRTADFPPPPPPAHSPHA